MECLPEVRKQVVSRFHECIKDNTKRHHWCPLIIGAPMAFFNLNTPSVFSECFQHEIITTYNSCFIPFADVVKNLV